MGLLRYWCCACAWLIADGSHRHRVLQVRTAASRKLIVASGVSRSKASAILRNSLTWEIRLIYSEYAVHIAAEAANAAARGVRPACTGRRGPGGGSRFVTRHAEPSAGAASLHHPPSMGGPVWLFSVVAKCPPVLKGNNHWTTE